MKNLFVDLGTHFGDGLMKHIDHYKIDDTWEIHTFEANPYTYAEFANVRNFTTNPSHLFRWINWAKVHYHNKAVWITDGEIDFHCCSAEKTKNLLETSEYFKEWMDNQEKDVASGKQICVYHKFDMPTDGASSIIDPRLMDRSNVNDVQKLFIWKEEDVVRVESTNFSRWLDENAKDKDRVVVKMDIEGAEFDVLQKCIEDGTIKYVSEINIEWHDWYLPQMKDRKHYLIQEMNRLGVKTGFWV